MYSMYYTAILHNKNHPDTLACMWQYIGFFTANYTKSKPAGKFQSASNEHAVWSRWCLSAVFWRFTHPLRATFKRKRAVHGSLWNYQPINNIYLQQLFATKK